MRLTPVPPISLTVDDDGGVDSTSNVTLIRFNGVIPEPFTGPGGETAVAIDLSTPIAYDGSGDSFAPNVIGPSPGTWGFQFPQATISNVANPADPGGDPDNSVVQVSFPGVNFLSDNSNLVVNADLEVTGILAVDEGANVTGDITATGNMICSTLETNGGAAPGMLLGGNNIYGFSNGDIYINSFGTGATILCAGGGDVTAENNLNVNKTLTVNATQNEALGYVFRIVKSNSTSTDPLVRIDNEIGVPKVTIDSSFNLQAQGFKSADGSSGATEDVIIGGVTLHYKNGIYVGHT